MVKEYDTLLNTYKRMFALVDVFHFNSQNTRDVYAQYLPIPENSAVELITHYGVSDHRRQRTFDGKKLKLGFVGSEAPYKGLPMLKRIIARLNKEGYEERVLLSVYGGKVGPDKELRNVEYKGRFSSTQMEAVYNSMDLLVVPSICFETFGFTVIEAIQYGVPALVSSKVGAQDIVKKYASQFIFEKEDDLFHILYRLIKSREELIHYNKSIVSESWQWSIELHAKDIENVFYK